MKHWLVVVVFFLIQSALGAEIEMMSRIRDFKGTNKKGDCWVSVWPQGVRIQDYMPTQPDFDEERHLTFRDDDSEDLNRRIDYDSISITKRMSPYDVPTSELVTHFSLNAVGNHVTVAISTRYSAQGRPARERSSECSTTVEQYPEWDIDDFRGAGNRETRIGWMEYLLEERGVDVNYVKKYKPGHLLFFAAMNGDLEAVNLFLSHGAKVDLSPSEGGSTPLMEAAVGGHLAVVQVLLDAGANMRGALAAACLNTDNLPVIRELVSRGADVGGEACLSLQVVNLETTKLLLQAGAQVNQKNLEGETPLMSASFWGVTEVVELLIVNGADVNLRDNERNTALHHLVMGGSATAADIVDLLVKAKINVNAKNAENKTALKLAREHDLEDLAKAIKDAQRKRTPVRRR